VAHAKSSLSSLGIAWQWIPTVSSASMLMLLPAGYSPCILAACELHSLIASSRLYCCAHGLLAMAQDLLPADPLPSNSEHQHSELSTRLTEHQFRFSRYSLWVDSTENSYLVCFRGVTCSVVASLSAWRWTTSQNHFHSSPIVVWRHCCRGDVSVAPLPSNLRWFSANMPQYYLDELGL
jgi:hypothetical protein